MSSQITPAQRQEAILRSCSDRLDRLAGLQVAVDHDPAHAEEQRTVRTAIDRAEFHRNRTAGPQPGPIAAPDWCPTMAEIRFLTPDQRVEVWRAAVRAAGRPAATLQTLALRRAASLGAYLVIAGCITEDRAREHLAAAAKRAGLPPTTAERVITSGYLAGSCSAFAEMGDDGAVSGHLPGAFSAVARASGTYDHEKGYRIDPASLVLGAGVLVHDGHHMDKEPVAVAVPSVRDGAVHVDAVFASSAGSAWTLVRTGRLCSVSIVANTEEFHTGANGRLVRGNLLAVDLVDYPADKKAIVGRVVEAKKMSAGQRRTQALFDQYLDDPKSPRMRSLMRNVELLGVEAMDVLAPVVAPLRAERARQRVKA